MPDMNNMTLPLPNPGDWMTIKAAGQLLSVDERTVRRFLDKGTLTKHHPYVATDEKPPVFIWRAEALALLGARNRVSGGAR